MPDGENVPGEAEAGDAHVLAEVNRAGSYRTAALQIEGLRHVRSI